MSGTRDAGGAGAGAETPVPWLDRLAHDLRGPLSPLQTASHLLQHEGLEPARRQELLQLLDRQARRMARMLEELEDWVRAGQGRLLGPREACEPALLLDYALVGAGLAGTPVDDDGAIATIDADPHRLTQLLRTLLDYAVAHGGPPALRLRSDADRVRIEATLPGTPPAADALDTLLDEREAEPYDQGLGLRLPLARRIARAHGGELAATIGDDGRLLLACDLPLSALSAGAAPPGSPSASP